ncbi:hypothetical protein HNP52_002270 [Sphingomonas kyeonggiensis]|uniref:Uncharacterized protein n=1 Tax=Sphingomonas kyeonggiensis TaxID=1268553 RepID=A0A7W7K1A0_9SPHN|nr:hypothetical protein [Sphingomonas kyeonggiensis]MBB4839201.1 hypothetical protein [Sphingomonas kyeonggiensis]
MPDTFQPARKSIEWAKRAIDEGLAELLEFGKDEGSFARQIVESSDPGTYIYKVVQLKDFPDGIERRWTEALNNLRNSFDQAMFAACQAINEPRKANYPWADNPGADLNHRLAGTRPTPTIPKSLWNEIRRQEPYPSGAGYSGGDTIVREVAKLANSKHSVGFEPRVQVGTVKFDRVDFGYDRPFLYINRPVWDPVKKEVEVFRARDAILSDHPQVSYGVFFRGSAPLLNLPAYDALVAFAEKAESVLEGFRTECARINAS